MRKYNGFRMYHNGETYCCVHDNGDSYFVIYNAKHPHDDEQTKYKTFDTDNRRSYLAEFLEKHGYNQIAWKGAIA